MKDKISYLEKNIDELINILNIVKNFEANLESIAKKIHKKIKKVEKFTFVEMEDQQQMPNT